jgi:hypothetical protein
MTIAASAASKARSASTRSGFRHGRSAPAGRSGRRATRISTPIAPCDGAGSCRRSARRPSCPAAQAPPPPAGWRRILRVELARRVWTLPRMVTAGGPAGGRPVRRPARRRSSDPGALGQSGDAVGADQPVACVGAPASRRPRTGPDRVSTSFIEWTERSVRPRRGSGPAPGPQGLAADLGEGRSWIRSPLVVIGTISIAFVPAMSDAQRSATICAWASAKGDPRVPMRRGRSIARLC